jgi:hypothetical protein
MLPVALAALLWPLAAAAAELTVLSVSPAPQSLATPVHASITVMFDRPVNSATLIPANVGVFGRWSGAKTGVFSVGGGGAAVSFDPDQPFSAGEQVMVVLSRSLQAVDGSFLRSAGYSFQFWTRAESAQRSFSAIDTMTTRTTPTISTRSYGGVGSDLNHDGWLDLTIVNEDSADLRVFLNRADGSGLYQDFIEPTFPVNDRASPNEPADFNRDGHTDIAVVNIDTNTVSILLGNGDGSFAPQQQVTVGGAPRGIALLDADGDGDIDIVNTNSSAAAAQSMSLLLNNGAGVFGVPAYFDSTVSNEWALAAADMNEDGILDLVIGCRSPQSVVVMRGNGNGTFSHVSTRAGAGLVWMLATGDVNADGHADAVTANSQSNTCGVLLGTGTGTLGAPALFATDPFPLATDLGDLDGDGDLDWVNSSYNGDWRVLINNGAGSFSFDQEIDAPQAASCAVPLDIDNDGDLDLALIDELADVVKLMKNSGTIAPGDINRDGVVDIADLLQLLALWGPCPALPLPCPGDVNHDGIVDVADLLALLASWS